MRVDVRGELARDRGFPVAPWTPIEVLGIAVLVPRALRSDEDHRTAERVERARQPADVPVLLRSRRQAVEEVDDGIVAIAPVVSGRQIGDEVEPAAYRPRHKRDPNDRSAGR